VTCWSSKRIEKTYSKGNVLQKRLGVPGRLVGKSRQTVYMEMGDKGKKFRARSRRA